MFCSLLGQPLLVLFCLLWPMFLHLLLPQLAGLQRLVGRWGWRRVLVVVHLLEAGLLTAGLVVAQVTLVPVLSTLLALLAAAIAQGGVLLCLAVGLLVGLTLALLDAQHLLVALGATAWPDRIAVLMIALLGLALAQAGFGQALKIHRSRLRWRRRGQGYQLLSDRLSRYVPAPLLQRLAQLEPSPVEPQWWQPLNWQRRWLTLVVVDLEGFSALSRRLSAEHTALVLNGFLQGIDQLAMQHGANLARFTGDGALLVWGDGLQAHASSPVHQVLQACQLCRALPQRLQATQLACAGAGAPVQLRARSAITSGYCTVGDWGVERLDYTVIGPSVNLAQRLQQLAPPNRTLLDEASGAVLAGEPSLGQALGHKLLGEARCLEIKGFGRVRAVALVPEAAG